MWALAKVKVADKSRPAGGAETLLVVSCLLETGRNACLPGRGLCSSFEQGIALYLYLVGRQ